MVATKIRGVWVALLLGSLLLAAGSVGMAQTVRDVPPSHWAYEAVMELVKRGYLTVEDGRFGGDQPADRFTLATVVARILHEIETGGVVPQSRHDVELLRSVVTEFREELVSAFARIDQTDARLDANVRDVAVVEEKISEVIEALTVAMEEIDALERQLSMGLAEQDARHQAELQGSLAQLRDLLEQSSQELASSQGALRNEVLDMIAELRKESEERIALLEANVRQALADSGIALGGLQQSLEADAARLRALEAEVEALSADLDTLVEGVEQVLAEIRSELNAQSEAIAAGQLALEEQRRQNRILEETDAELLKGIEAALERVAAMQARVDALESMKAQIDGVERQVLAMQSQIGLSEEQLRALSDRLMNELESQYQHSFLLSGTVAEELKSLREEFNSYRQKTERELSSARQAQMFGIIGALLGLIGLAN